ASMSQPATDLQDLGPALGLQPPQNHPHDYSGPGALLGRPPQQPSGITVCHHHQPPPPPATPPAITAMTVTSALALAITPPVTATSAPAPATPGAPPAHAETPIMHHDHASLQT
ncbi:hypothetical protein C0993_008160, partial [Termitomyces sp. T159_Od127]